MANAGDGGRGTPRRTLLVGAGNPTRGDDAAGVHVVRRLVEHGLPPGCEAAELRGGWIGLLDRLGPFERLVVVDAVDVGLPAGTVVELDLGAGSGEGALPTPTGHATGLLEVLALADRMGLSRPAEVTVLGIQVEDLSAYSERLSQPLAATLEESCRAVLGALSGEGG